jgi:hypothetical protein
MIEVRRKTTGELYTNNEIVILTVKLRSAVARLNRVYSCGMISKTRVCLMLIMASILLGGLARADNSTLTFAQNSFGNATDSAKAEEQLSNDKVLWCFPAMIYTATNEKVPTLGIKLVR